MRLVAVTTGEMTSGGGNPSHRHNRNRPHSLWAGEKQNRALKHDRTPTAKTEGVPSPRQGRAARCTHAGAPVSEGKATALPGANSAEARNRRCPCPPLAHRTRGVPLTDVTQSSPPFWQGPHLCSPHAVTRRLCWAGKALREPGRYEKGTRPRDVLTLAPRLSCVLLLRGLGPPVPRACDVSKGCC